MNKNLKKQGIEIEQDFKKKHDILRDNVKLLLEFKQLKVKELVDQSGLSHSYISGHLLNESVDINPSLKVLVAIAYALNVPMQLLYEEKLGQLLIKEAKDTTDVKYITFIVSNDKAVFSENPATYSALE